MASVVVLVGTLGGVVATAWMQRDSKKMASLNRMIEKYRYEIRSRQAQEVVVSEWLVELGAANTAESAKRKLRDRTEKMKGLRPKIGRVEVQDI